ncbi:MAG: Rne/Rng family ribonuclease [Balneolales bacterium]|nr:Rne/Rng family ribonuclease [Balneolales bacterium]
MKNQIIIHAAGKQTRIALLENNELAQLFIESPENQRTVGDIYLAEVRKVMGGIRAAFIDMNTPKDAFLHFSDLGEHLDDYLIMLNGQDSIPQDALKRLRDFREKKDDSQNTKNGTSAEEQNLLGALLKPGHKVLVQIVKEPIGSKGPRVSTNISIAGRFLVLIPMGDYVAVSKRIRSYKERRQLRQAVADILPEGFGVIVRTVAEGQNPKMIEDDLKDVLDKWNEIVKNLETAKPPSLLHRDLDMTESLVRDLFAKDFERILVDDAKMFKTLRHYVSKIAPAMLPNLEYYKGSAHVFDHMNIMQDVESVFSPRVKMPSGGYLIFEQTEAMYVVDVNSGRYAAKKAQEDNSLKTNLESAREIAKQLRLRDIGGIIVVDFIDLREEVNRKKVYDELKKEFRKDRAKTNVLPMSDFGLIQITRQRIRPSVVKSVSKVCPMCGGGGSIVTQNTILSDIESWLAKFRRTTSYRSVDLHINPYMRGMLTKGWVSQHFKWMMKYRIRIGIVEDVTLSMNDYKFTLSASDVDITETIVMDQSIDTAIKAAEQSIAELESELKRDSTTLDIYKKEKTAQPTRTTIPSRERSKDEQRSENRRSASSQSRDTTNRPQQTRPSAQQNEVTEKPDNGRSTSRTRDAEPKKEQDRQVDQKQSDNRRNQKISKYYKKTDDDIAADNGSKAATPKPKSEAPPKEATKPASEAEIPDELSHLRSAWEVAKEYKIKREKELQSQPDNNEATVATENVKSDEAATDDKVAEKTDSTPAKVAYTSDGKRIDPNEESKAPAQVEEAKSEETNSKTETSEPETAPVKKAATKKAPAKKVAKSDSVTAASSIVQSLVSSSKLKEDKKDDAPEDASVSEKAESTVEVPKKKPVGRPKKKPAPGKKAKTAEEVAKKTAAKRKTTKKAAPTKKDSPDDATSDNSDVNTEGTATDESGEQK